MFFRMSTLTLAVVLVVIVGGATVAGMVIGRRLRSRSPAHREPVGVVQGTMLGLVGLLLAFGLTMAVGRYEARRALVVQESNDIGTTFLRAQLLAEPARSESLGLLKDYADATVDLAGRVTDTHRFADDDVRIGSLQRELWAAAGDAVRGDPAGTAPRLYIETLNAMIDTHTTRVASLRNRVPNPVMILQVVGSAIALGVLSLYLAMLGRSAVTSLVAASVVLLILFISFDLDRPQRGFITVPAAPLVAVRASMDRPPAAGGP
jgi:hypothetical protein